MLNSERIFSDSRTRAGIEDAFFHRAMALYCENESKKVIAEMEADRTERESNAKPLERIFAKLRRERGFSSAFRIAKKVTDRVALLVLAAVIVFAGAVTASADVRSSLAEFTSRWGTFKNMAGETFNLNGEDVKSFSVNYVLGWNFDSDGYKKIVHESKVFGGIVYLPSSSYYVNYTYGINNYPAAICNGNSYRISYEEPTPIKGIITTNRNGNATFYPYYNENGDNLYIVCEREEYTEYDFEKNTHLYLPDGTEAKVQPFGIGLNVFKYDPNGGDAGSTSNFDEICPENSGFVEAEIMFEDISVFPRAVSEDDGIFDTRALGLVHSFDDITVTKVINDSSVTPTSEIKHTSPAGDNALFSFSIPDTSDSGDFYTAPSSKYLTKIYPTQSVFPLTADEQLFLKSSEAADMAYAIGTFTGVNSYNIDSGSWTFFDSLENADPDELLYIALLNAATVQMNETYHFAENLKDSTVEFRRKEDENSPLGIVMKSAAKEGVRITKAVLSVNVESTFYNMFGYDTECELHSLEKYGWRYIPEIGRFVTDCDPGCDNIAIRPMNMQILSIEQSGDTYLVEAVPCCHYIDPSDGKPYVWLYSDPKVKVTESNKEKLLEGPHYYYTLQKTADNFYVLNNHYSILAATCEP